MPVLDTFNLPRQSIEPQQLPRQTLAGALAAAISPAICAIFFFEIAAAKSRPRLFLPRQSPDPDYFAAAKSRYACAIQYRSCTCTLPRQKQSGPRLCRGKNNLGRDFYYCTVAVSTAELSDFS